MARTTKRSRKRDESVSVSCFSLPTVEICIPVYNILNGYTTLSFQATKRRLYGRTHDKAKFQVSFTLSYFAGIYIL